MLLLQIIILMVLIFGGLLFVLHSILTKNISTATGHLDELNAEFSKREEEVKKRQAEAEKYYDEMVGKAKDEVDRLRQEADTAVAQERDKILEEARVSSEQIIQKAQKTKEMLTNELRQEMETKIVSRIRELVQNVFPDNIRQELHKLWLNDLLCEGLSSLKTMRVPEDVQEVRLVSAFPLTSSEKAALAKKFKEQLNKDVVFKEEVDPALIAGVLISIGSLVLDGTVANRIEKVVTEHA